MIKASQYLNGLVISIIFSSTNQANQSNIFSIQIKPSKLANTGNFQIISQIIRADSNLYTLINPRFNANSNFNKSISFKFRMNYIMTLRA